MQDTDQTTNSHKTWLALMDKPWCVFSEYVAEKYVPVWGLTVQHNNIGIWKILTVDLGESIFWLFRMSNFIQKIDNTMHMETIILHDF